MGLIGAHRPVLLIAAVTSRFAEAFDWGLAQAESKWGKAWSVSERYAFTETSYYEKSMGDSLQKQFWVFENLIDPAGLPETKHVSNQWELDYLETSEFDVQRPINIDPGYITEAKLVLATTKDRDHRIYLDRGIYAEVTLHYHRGSWQARPWTYPDYQRADFQSFFSKCRDELRRRYRNPTHTS